MQPSYPVHWRAGDGETGPATMRVTQNGLVLEGGGRRLEVPSDEIAHVRVADEDGRNAVVVERRGDEPLTVMLAHGGDEDGMIGALLTLETLAARRRRIAVIAPLKPGSHQAAAELLRAGPPFDPEQINALERHDVLLTPREAIFVFDFSDDSGAFATLAADPSLLVSATQWNDLLDGPPRIGDLAFSWSRTPEADGASYLATPGPGDSEGGDVY